MHGPFELDKHSSLTWKQLFREQTRRYPGLSDAAGVYIIATTNRTKDSICYIGMTHWQGFEAEAFSQRNVELVWDVISEMRNRAIKIWLIAKRTPARKGFSWDSRIERQSFLLETLLIMHAKAAGHRLINTSKMKSAEGIAVEGLFGKRKRGRQSAGSTSLASALGLLRS
ncbi:MAG: hypothetical protein H7X93_14500 [Sphingomonadaceae bacterium]|nr:hypothetical protein [Sphingomonadaceae bacterium]